MKKKLENAMADNECERRTARYLREAVQEAAWLTWG
jgi:hypothetical protein